MSALSPDLQAKGLLDQRLAILGTEFVRTPRINDNDGRDHDDGAVTHVPAGRGGARVGKRLGRWMGGVVRFDWVSAGSSDRQGHSERLGDTQRQLRTGSREYR